MWWFKKKKVLLITVSSATTCTLCKISSTACVSECLCKCPLACGNLHRTFLPQDNSNLHKTLKKALRQKRVKMEKGIQQTNYNK